MDKNLPVPAEQSVPLTWRIPINLAAGFEDAGLHLQMLKLLEQLGPNPPVIDCFDLSRLSADNLQDASDFCKEHGMELVKALDLPLHSVNYTIDEKWYAVVNADGDSLYLTEEQKVIAKSDAMYTVMSWPSTFEGRPSRTYSPITVLLEMPGEPTPERPDMSYPELMQVLTGFLGSEGIKGIEIK